MNDLEEVFDVHDIVKGVEKAGDEVKEELSEAACNYVTPEGVYQLKVGKKPLA